VEAHALRQRGWSISAIARHLNRDPKTIRGYLNGDRQPGFRRTSAADPLALVESYIRLRFADDCHVWASALYDEVVPLGYALSYTTFVRQIRSVAFVRTARPAGGEGQGHHRDRPPRRRGDPVGLVRTKKRPLGGTAYVLLGTLPHSGRIRGCWPTHGPAHLIEAMDKVMRRLGGTAHVWRTDRLITVIKPGTGDVQRASPPWPSTTGPLWNPAYPRRGNRKGSVESSVRFCSGRWWRTLVPRTPSRPDLARPLPGHDR